MVNVGWHHEFNGAVVLLIFLEKELYQTPNILAQNISKFRVNLLLRVSKTLATARLFQKSTAMERSSRKWIGDLYLIVSEKFFFDLFKCHDNIVEIGYVKLMDTFLIKYKKLYNI